MICFRCKATIEGDDATELHLSIPNGTGGHSSVIGTLCIGCLDALKDWVAQGGLLVTDEPPHPKGRPWTRDADNEAG